MRIHRFSGCWKLEQRIAKSSQDYLASRPSFARVGYRGTPRIFFSGPSCALLVLRKILHTSGTQLESQRIPRHCRLEIRCKNLLKRACKATWYQYHFVFWHSKESQKDCKSPSKGAFGGPSGVPWSVRGTKKVAKNIQNRKKSLGFPTIIYL